mmetsp:Transcript_12728/g.32640  ORF Transcript_12728/g.32640 Transcript_12728/m.32640 type:complete len:523 (-) Transcript_12728:243-1811(-)|eukprot:jgi/Tetstr1/428829/TSEL_018816.t1
MATTSCRSPAAALLLLLLAAAVIGARSAIHRYEGSAFLPAGHDTAVFRGGREGLFASAPPSEVSAGLHTVSREAADGQSFIRLSKVVFERPAAVARRYRALDGETGFVDALVFEVGDRELVGHVEEDGSHRFCCTPQLAAKIRCTPGHVIVKPQPQKGRSTPWVESVVFRGNDTEAHGLGTAALPISETGMYHLWFVACGAELAEVRVEGLTTWKNPHGYLPGMMASYMPFFGYMSIAFLSLGAAWLALYCYNWRDVIPLQHCVTALIFLGMMEMSTWYFDFVNFNTTGLRPVVTTLWAVMFGSLRKTVARMLVLVVSMGYGVVKPTLGGLTNKVWSLGLAYFVACIALDMVTHVGTVDDLPSMARVVLVLPVAVLDAVVILWIFSSLSKTLTQLGARKQTVKLQLYRNFTNTLAIAVWISICWIAYELYFKFNDSEHTEKWEFYWVTDAFWQVLSFGVLLVICILWRPSHNSQCYAYTEADAAEEEMGEAGGAVGKGDAEQGTINTDVFSIEEEPEESKMA